MSLFSFVVGTTWGKIWQNNCGFDEIAIPLQCQNEINKKAKTINNKKINDYEKECICISNSLMHDTDG
jgi:hypothetical protein